MHRTASLLALLAVAFPASVTAHPCEAQVQAAEERVRDKERKLATFRDTSKFGELLSGKRERSPMHDATQRQLNEELAQSKRDLKQEKDQCSKLVREEQEASRKATEATRAEAASATTSKKSDTAGGAGCTKDIECKGDRICVSGSCVDPPKK